MGVFNKKRKIKGIGLALGGGGARGFAHIGVIKAFEENNIKFDFVAGTSVGSLIGALYCAGKTSEDMIDMAKKVRVKDIRTSKIPLVPSKTDGIEAIIKNCVPDNSFSSLKMPFASVAVDVITGEECVMLSGDLAKSVAGSCAVPGIFAPVSLGDKRLFDGGLSNTVPSDIPKKFGCSAVVAVDINSTRGSGTNSEKLVDLITASFRITMKSTALKGYLNSDIMIKPDLKRFKASKKDGYEEMIEEGYKAAMEQMPAIKALFRQSKLHARAMKIEDKLQKKLIDKKIRQMEE